MEDQLPTEVGHYPSNLPANRAQSGIPCSRQIGIAEWLKAGVYIEIKSDLVMDFPANHQRRLPTRPGGTGAIVARSMERLAA